MKKLILSGLMLGITAMLQAACPAQNGDRYNNQYDQEQNRYGYDNQQGRGYDNQQGGRYGYDNQQGGRYGYDNQQGSRYGYDNQDNRDHDMKMQGQMGENQDRYLSPADRDLMKKIRSELSGYETVSVVVNNGDVTLQGVVNTQQDKQKVEEKVRNVKGVRTINNQINVSKKA